MAPAPRDRQSMMLVTRIQIRVSTSAMKSANGMNSPTPETAAAQPSQRGSSRAAVTIAPPAPSIITPSPAFQAIQPSVSRTFRARIPVARHTVIGRVGEGKVRQGAHEQNRRRDGRP
jgi:hypothetical protein